jgi:ABC-2 type transport system ATP-binding protein
MTIKLESVTKHYRDFAAVRDLSFQVKDREIFGIIGHNGAGKTTTLKMIMGLLAPSSGSIEVLGNDMIRNSISVKGNIGYLPEESPLYENMTVNE